MPEQLTNNIVPLRVLVVDDNELSAQTMGWTIEAQGHEVRLAYSGSKAIETAKDFIPHVVLLDIGLPDMNGFEICQVMKQSVELMKTTFVAQTGWSQDQHRQMSKEAGFDYHLVKPVDPKILQDLLNSVTAKKLVN